jgi:hypothetical protein
MSCHAYFRPGRLLSLVAIGMLSLAACGDQRPPAYSVTGQVLFQNKPAEHAIVIFHPDATDEELAKLRPHATVDANGHFELTTYVPGDGAPAGSYRVTVTWPSNDPADRVAAEDPEYTPSGPDRLKGRFANAAKTPLQATVTSGANVLTLFEVK